MRHNKKVNHLGRTKAHREAMFANMASSLIKHKRIFTTTAKAKALRKYVEPLITKSKEVTDHSQRVVCFVAGQICGENPFYRNIAEGDGASGRIYPYH